jgi:hypothetical protein
MANPTDFDVWFAKVQAVLEQAPQGARYTAVACDGTRDQRVGVSYRVCCPGHAYDLLDELVGELADEFSAPAGAILQ